MVVPIVARQIVRNLLTEKNMKKNKNLWHIRHNKTDILSPAKYFSKKPLQVKTTIN